MADNFHIAIPELNAFVARYRNAPAVVTEELRKAGARVGVLVERRAKTLVPVDTGHLRRSITNQVTASPMLVTTTIGTNVPYARAVEFGRGAGKTPPPSAPIAAWLGRHGGDPGAAFVVARAIGRRGIKGRPFLTRALRELRGQIQTEFRRVPRAVIARIGGR
jgi:hypothetical protein